MASDLTAPVAAPSRLRPLRMGLYTGGAAIAGVGLLADVLVAGEPGFGGQQRMLVLAGLALAGGGALTVEDRRTRFVEAVGRATGTPVLGPLQFLALTLLLATAGGLGEAAALAVRRFALDEMPRASQQLVWLASVANVVVLGAMALMLWAVGYIWQGFRSGRVVTFVLGWFVADTLLQAARFGEWLDPWASWMLAAGFGAVLARELGGRTAFVERRLPAVAASLLVLVAITGAGTFAHRGIRERLLLGGLAEADAGAPNVILIILDTVRSLNLSLYGYERATTPNLERLAATGVVFDDAIAPAPWTLPSHATLFTGVDPDRLSANWRAPLDDAQPTLAEHLSARGYATAAFSANHSYVTVETGLGRGFARFEDFVVSRGELVRSPLMPRRMLNRLGASTRLNEHLPGRKTAHDINGAFLRWLTKRGAERPERPFFAFLNYFDAHDPYYAPPPFDTLYGAGGGQVRDYVWGTPPGPELVESWITQYDRSLTYLDSALGELFDELQRRGVLDRTILVITSDHGELLGEHGFMRHGSTLYRPVLTVPLLVRYPAAVPAGRRVADPVTLRDIPSTILQLAGPTAQAPMPGNPLSRYWTDDPATGAAATEPVYSETRRAVRIPPRYPNAAADLKSLVLDGYHYIHSSRGREELYHYRNDPDELDDLIDDESAGPTVEAMRRLLAARAADPTVAAAARR